MALVWAVVGIARAHDPGLSAAQVWAEPGRIHVVVTLSPADVAPLLTSRSVQEIRPENFPVVAPELEELAKGWWTLTRGDDAVPVTRVAVRLLPGDDLVFDLTFRLSAGADGDVAMTLSEWERLPPGHRCFVIMTWPGEEVGIDALLTRNRPTFTFAWPIDAPADRALRGPSFAEFVLLGVRHILTGYDHLLFLFGLLLVCVQWRPILTIVTSFTVGHSITLIGATLGWVSLPSYVVEPLIAASIIYVGVENLVRRGEAPKGRRGLVLLFGMIHGFGFASVLRDLGIGSEGRAVAVPLVGFNLGVELGQIGVAMVVLPLLWQLRKIPGFLTRGVPVLSTLVGLGGLYWLIERVVT